MHKAHTALRAILALALLAGVSACTPAHNQGAWENVHSSSLIGNIYTGDDHI